MTVGGLAIRPRVGARPLFRAELTKIACWRRTQIAVVLCVVGPFAAIAGIDAQQNLPRDTLFGRHVNSSGFAAALLILGFAGQWLLPVLVSVVAGDVFSSEDHHGTWKLLLTRSAARNQVFWAKSAAAAVWSVGSTVLFALSSVVAGVLLVGDRPLIGLSGQTLQGVHALGLVAAAWASVLAPVLGFTGLALLSSAVGRSTILGIAAPPVAGLAMQLLSLLDVPTWFQRALLTSPLSSWHALFTVPSTTSALVIAVGVSLSWAVCGLVGACYVVARREHSA